MFPADYLPVSKDIYARLKIIEDRMAYLEGQSPEYLTFFKEENKTLSGSVEINCRDNRQEILDSLPQLNTKIQVK
jgi:hypothetical protein